MRHSRWPLLRSPSVKKTGLPRPGLYFNYFIYSEIHFEITGQDLYLGYCFEITLSLNSFNCSTCISECLLCVRNSTVKAFYIVFNIFLHYLGVPFKNLIQKKIIPINLAVCLIVKLSI